MTVKFWTIKIVFPEGVSAETVEALEDQITEIVTAVEPGAVLVVEQETAEEEADG